MYVTVMEFTVDGMVYDFCVTIYSSVKPFVQQAYPIQPSVTAPISGNSFVYSHLLKYASCVLDVMYSFLTWTEPLLHIYGPICQAKDKSQTNTNVVVPGYI